MKKNILLLSVSFFLFSCSSSSKDYSNTNNRIDGAASYESIEINLNYKNLAILDYDQVNDLINEKIKDYQKYNNTQSLKEAALMVFSRPDTDGVVSKVLSLARSPLEDENIWESTLVQIVRQSVDRMKSDAISAEQQVTAGVVLENILSEIKPEYKKQYDKGGIETDIVEFIVSQNPRYSQKANKDRALTLMKSNPSPGTLANNLYTEKINFLKQKQK